MERRALVATLLSALVLFAWLIFFPPNRPPKVERAGGAAEPVATTAVPTAPTPAAQTGGQAAAGPAAEAPPSGPAAARGAAAEDIPLEGPGWKAVVSSQGGAVRSLVLRSYNDEAGKPLELLGAPTLTMVADGPWNAEPYVVTRDGDAVGLRWSDGQGSWVEKRLAPGKGSYGLEVEVRAGGRPAAGGVLVAVGREVPPAQASRFGSVGGAVRVNGKLERVNPAKLPQPREITGAIEYAGVEDHYFLDVFLPDGHLGSVQVSARPGGGATPVPVVAVVGDGGVVKGTLFAGPKEHGVLAGYGRSLEDTMSLGWFGVISLAFLVALRWIHSFVGNWGVAIIILTAAIRVVLFPLTHKSTVAMRRMQALQPKMKAIQERYQERAKKDPQVRLRMNQEVMGLYKQEGVNPMGGCLPTLVQLPILWALYTLFANAIELRHAPFMLWIRDLSIKDPTYITPILMTATMFLQQKMAPQVGDPAQRRMFMIMPLVFGFMFMSFPAGLVLYWLVNNVLTIGQQVLTERILSDAKAK